MKRFKSFFTLVIGWSLHATTAWAQTPFFTHTVEAGETVYSIAKIYQIATEDIYNMNPDTRNGLRSGSVLKIPQNKASQHFSRFHTIAKGETLYQLTKLYQVSAEDICMANPGLTASNFKVGEVLVIPPSNGKAPQTEAPKTNTQPTGCKEMHKVKRRETAFSIAREYQVTMEQLVRANPEMQDPDFKLKKGSWVCIPYPETKPTEKPAPSNQELFPKKSGPEKMKQIKMGVLLPLTQNNSDSKKMIEFYQGLLLAVEDMKNQGLSTTIYTYDCGKTETDMQLALNKTGLADADIIFGPLHNVQIPTLSKFCKKNKVKLVIPFSSHNDEVYKNPYVYLSNVPKNILFEETYKLLLSQFAGNQFVIWNNGEQRADDQLFIQGLKKMLTAQNIPFREVNSNGDVSALRNSMTMTRKNVIVSASSSLKAMHALSAELLLLIEQQSGHKFCLLGHPEWQMYSQKQGDNFFRFDTYIFSSFYKNMNQPACIALENRFKKEFHSNMQNTYPSFGLLGYDLGRFFLNGMATQGSNFNDKIGGLKTTPLQNDFHFKRASNWSGFINNKAELIHYTPQKKIDVIEFTR